MAKYHIKNKNSRKAIKKEQLKPIPLGLMKCDSKIVDLPNKKSKELGYWH